MDMVKPAERWLLAEPDQHDQIRLFCFPFAGGGASIYRGWAQELPAGVGVYPIQLPGRENRLMESAIREMDTLVAAISQAIQPYLDRPFLFFGHSLGTKIAFELARSVRRNWQLAPSRLIVSGARAPHIPEPNPLYHLPQELFVEELRRFAGTPEAILRSKELMGLFMPLLRADFTLDDTYLFKEEPPLECPISAFCGTHDREASEEEMAAWAQHTAGDFAMSIIEGEHFFLTTNREELLRQLSPILAGHLKMAGNEGASERR
ncbi:thioesterase II family protein [Brevibacillus parabrevis]|uniref:thioesterase II family protein n=1 Tax=Brevibacillus parabrevis TaxID=54914 RepID=UPI002E21748D|nr:alpha/beta fold hydrolase [Brevibacillus parabrevis]